MSVFEQIEDNPCDTMREAGQRLPGHAGNSVRHFPGSVRGLAVYQEKCTPAGNLQWRIGFEDPGTEDCGYPLSRCAMSDIRPESRCIKSPSDPSLHSLR